MLGLGLRGTEANAIRAEEVLMAAVQGGDHVLIDATERAPRHLQEDTNSVSTTAAKKRHMLKNTVMSLPEKLIIFLGRTFSGHNHDYFGACLPQSQS